MKRFYEKAGLVAREDGFSVVLDGRPVRTPAKQALRLPGEALAKAVAAEWLAQGAELDPSTMPMTRLSNTALDRTAAMREAVIEQIAAFGRSDLLCYRATDPDELVRRQDDAWQPLLDWLEERFAARLAVTAGVAPVEQDEGALLALYSAVAGYDDFTLTGLHAATVAGGSVVLGLALAEGRIDPATAFECSQLDELFQAERWGEDSEAAVRRSALRQEIDEAARFIALVNGRRHD
jgi:chaperone required for assembly of F1-ATPase